MKEETQSALQASLVEEKATLERQLSEIGVKDETTKDWEAVPENSEAESDENDLADRSEDFEERTATLNTLESRLKEIIHALEKIEKADGSFGVCEVSGEEIEEDRLRANPAARTCISHIDTPVSAL
jgi:DnaK suppressor protein